ncbi:hypothetical protein [Atopococcus tabaci]|uniref:hypothetical protein n=1 Tax=Atopococcus tabaci TaxID=269774 RepID=UPI00240977BA|nr:hypothetical protein [Atopococcus tabaci]
MRKNNSFLPLRLQLFAENEPADVENEEEVDKTEETEEQTFTQADIDRAIAERVKRLEAKHKKQLDALQAKPPKGEENDEAETLKATVEEKDKELANAHMQLEALKAGVPADKVEKFVKLASLSEEEELADRVAETLKEFPEFGAQQEETVAKKRIVPGGNPSGNAGTMTKEEIMAIKDPVERVEQITKNSHLFK